MLFNSFGFIFLFLPLVLVGFFWIGRRSSRAAECWLLGASLVFYIGWSFDFLWLLIASIAFNFSISLLLVRSTTPRKLILTAGIGANLIALFVFKYLDLFVDTVNSVTPLAIEPPHLTLPVGISFYTFTQIAYLVDTYNRQVKDFTVERYALFVSYFPHLIAGPILHHKPFMAQFSRRETYALNWQNILVGFFIFTIGLAKKVLIADSLAPFAVAVFDRSAAGGTVGFYASWAGALCYTFQLYFDFSGYSDMAVGISRMLGIRIPINFLSPYKSRSIVEFWRRWHISLSTFLRDYLYIPLGGNRRGEFVRFRNIVVTMALGGLWHGANWTFLVWGLLHGFYLVINHVWHAIVRRPSLRPAHPIVGFPGWLLTFVAVVAGWVFFRSDTIAGALALLSSMAGFNGFEMPGGFAEVARAWQMDQLSLRTFDNLFAGDPTLLRQPTLTLLPALLAAITLAFFCPNCLELTEKLERALARDVAVVPRPLSLAMISVGCLFGVSICYLNNVTPFLYFQF